MNYLVKDGAFYMTSYAKAQKVLNVRRNPEVGVMVETGDSYAELRGVMVDAEHCRASAPLPASSSQAFTVIDSML